MKKNTLSSDTRGRVGSTPEPRMKTRGTESRNNRLNSKKEEQPAESQKSESVVDDDILILLPHSAERRAEAFLPEWLRRLNRG